MAANALYPVGRTDQVLTEQVGDELVVYDELAQKAHCLSPEAASVWRCCDGTNSEAELAEDLGLSPYMVSQALAELDEANLLVRAGSGTLLPNISRRQMIKVAGVGAGAAVAAPLVFSVPVAGAANLCSKAKCSTSQTGQTFDGTPLTCNDYLWVTMTFGTNAPVGSTISLSGASLTLTPPGGGSVTVNLPDSIITVLANNGVASSSYQVSPAGHPNGLWTMSEPVSGAGGTMLLTAMAVPITGVLCGAASVNPAFNNVQISTSVPGVKISANYSAAVYPTTLLAPGLMTGTAPHFDYSNLGVLVVDSSKCGTPETAISDNVCPTGGGTGGGSCGNATGSLNGNYGCTTAC